MSRQRVSCVLTGVFAAVAAVAAAQPPGGAPARGRVGGGPGQPPGGGTMDFMAAEAPVNPIVTGAPYSGEGVTTVVQTLADGTRIERTVHARVYRDSEGRTRREQTIIGFGPAGEAQSVTIVDPVARLTYVLNPERHEGRRSPIPALRERRPGDAPPPPPPAPVGSGDAGAGAPPPPPPPPPGPGMAPRREPAGRGAPARGVPNAPESLGTRQLEGLTVVGTRRTEVIATGRIGNDRPIEVADERWESQELKVLVMSRHHDPRTGDVEYRLTNILRADPPREMFAPSSDYVITDAPPPPPPAPRRPE